MYLNDFLYCGAVRGLAQSKHTEHCVPALPTAPEIHKMGNPQDTSTLVASWVRQKRAIPERKVLGAEWGRDGPVGKVLAMDV